MWWLVLLNLGGVCVGEEGGKVTGKVGARGVIKKRVEEKGWKKWSYHFRPYHSEILYNSLIMNRFPSFPPLVKRCVYRYNDSSYSSTNIYNMSYTVFQLSLVSTKMVKDDR